MQATLIYTALFTLTGLLGIWAAYDREGALLRWTPILASFLLMLATTQLPSEQAATWVKGLGLLSAPVAFGLSLYYLQVHSWQTVGYQDFSILPAVTDWLQSHRFQTTLSRDISDNLMAGCLVVLLPLGLGGIVSYWQHRPLALIASGMLLFACFTLFITASRGALMGLAVGVFAATYILWRTRVGVHAAYERLLDLVLVTSLTIIGIGYFLSLVSPGLETFIPLGTSGVAGSRLGLWHETLPLISDYRFTGSGLGSTAMVYASYVFQLHDPYLYHAHQLYLQIAVEQGLPGLFCFIGMAGCGLWLLVKTQGYLPSHSRFTGAVILAAMTGLLGHGFFDAELYVSNFLPILFVPLIAGLALQRTARSRYSNNSATGSTNKKHSRIPTMLATITPGIASIVLIFWPGAQAALQDNLGAVAQTRAELSIYHWPTIPLQDVVRRNALVDLAPAIRRYEWALAADPNNVTAHQRLGQILLSQGHYVEAQQHLEQAYLVEPQRRVVRQLLGEVNAVQGKLEPATALWQSIEISQKQFETRRWWYEFLGAHQEVTWLDEVRQAALRAREQSQ